MFVEYLSFIDKLNLHERQIYLTVVIMKLCGVSRHKRKKKRRKRSKPREELELQEYNNEGSTRKSEILEEKLTQYILKSSVKKEKEAPTSSKG